MIAGDLGGEVKLVFRDPDKTLLGVHVIGEGSSTRCSVTRRSATPTSTRHSTDWARSRGVGWAGLNRRPSATGDAPAARPARRAIPSSTCSRSGVPPGAPRSPSMARIADYWYGAAEADRTPSWGT